MYDFEYVLYNSIPYYYFDDFLHAIRFTVHVVYTVLNEGHRIGLGIKTSFLQLRTMHGHLLT